MLKYVISKKRLYIESIDKDIPDSDICIATDEDEIEINKKLGDGFHLGVVDGKLQAVPISRYSDEFYNQQKINAEAKDYLYQTDWITAKYIDEVIIKKITTEEKYNLKYGEVIEKRKQARESIIEVEVIPLE